MGVVVLRNHPTFSITCWSIQIKKTVKKNDRTISFDNILIGFTRGMAEYITPLLINLFQ